MPTRLIREGINSSDRIDLLDNAEEVFYRRLLNVVDDYGRYSAKPALLQAACFPLRGKTVMEEHIEAWLGACEKANLLQLYTGDDSKDYLQIYDFRQQVRAAASKFPPPPGSPGETPRPLRSIRSAPAKQTHSNGLAPAKQEAPKPPKPKDKPAKGMTLTQAELVADGLPENVATDWLAHRRAKKALLTHTAWEGIKKQADIAGWPVADACAEAMQRGWTGFNAEWLHEAKGQRETAYTREQRERVAQFMPNMAVRKPPAPITTVLEDVTDVADKSH